MHEGYVPEKCDSYKPNPHVWRTFYVLDIPVRCYTVKLTPLPISTSRIPQVAGCGGEERGDYA
jgi:hypothetical protein